MLRFLVILFAHLKL